MSPLTAKVLLAQALILGFKLGHLVVGRHVSMLYTCASSAIDLLR